MSIAPFSFRDFGAGEGEYVSSAAAKAFLPHGRKKEEAPPPPPPPPIFSEEEVKTAERDSYQKGFLAGVIEGKAQAEGAQAEIDKALAATVDTFASHLSPLFAIYRNLLKEQAAQLPQLSHAIAKKIAGDALDKNAYALIEEICLRCITAMQHEPKLTITVHESMKSTLEAKIAAAAQHMQAGEILVIGDAAIAPPHCRIEWKNGAMARDTNSLSEQVEQIITSMVTSHAREVDALCDDIEPSIIAVPDKGE